MFSTSINFDLSVFELFVPLAVGASVVVVRDAVSLVSDPVDVSLVNTVPSVMSRLVELGGVPESVRTVDLAGEPLSRDLVERIFATTGVREVRNLFGPSETTTYSTYVVMRREQGFVS
ncbi:AMP-binding protein, partial [Streptomyces sp. 5-10]|uniref:AMP-binding protein n=1 Tax=Streptomyces sp. 5-10 TaxID=878925 RepID=UPI00168A6B75